MAGGFLGIDLGTGSVTMLVVAAGYAEPDPDDWWRSTVLAVREAVAAAGRVPIAAIGLSGQIHGTVLTGEDGESIGPAIIWADTRSTR
jgi:xylulokinase